VTNTENGYPAIDGTVVVPGAKEFNIGSCGNGCQFMLLRFKGNGREEEKEFETAVDVGERNSVTVIQTVFYYPMC
jgi:hypothetical protein